jgi:pyruvate dehydrogenase E2 component (dihydrolipoamide acetyltransferase)
VGEEPAPVRPAPQVAETGTAKGDVRIEEPTRLQQVVARRMAEAKATIPDFQLTTEVDMERAVALRNDLRRSAGEDGAVPSYNDMVVKATALALRDVPRANAAYKDNRFELYSRVNVGVAVAAQDSLVVPTVFDADAKTLGEIGTEIRELAARVREGTVTPPELSGGTFTVSNLGMYGVTEFTAVINPPQAGILAVGALQQEPRVVDGKIVPRHVMRITVVADHRILYGADAARFLARIRELLEQPLSMAL